MNVKAMRKHLAKFKSHVCDVCNRVIKKNSIYYTMVKGHVVPNKKYLTLCPSCASVIDNRSYSLLQ